MRWILIAPLAGASLFAQAPANAPDETQPAEPTAQAAPAPGEGKPSLVLPLSPEKRKQLDDARSQVVEQLRETLKNPRGKVMIEVKPNGKVALAPGRRCAIPLTNMLPQSAAKADEKMIFPVPQSAPDKYTMKEFSLPAPSCDDVKR